MLKTLLRTSVSLELLLPTNLKSYTRCTEVLRRTMRSLFESNSAVRMLCLVFLYSAGAVVSLFRLCSTALV